MRLLLIDCEATGTNPLEDRLLTIFVGIMEDNGSWSRELHLMFDPGVDIPEEATNVHGITREIAKAEGIPESEAQKSFQIIRNAIVNTVRDENIPIAVYNGSYDFTLINEEFVRYGLKPISWEDSFIIDPIILDKQIDKYRKGSRTLTNVANHYGVEVDESKTHDASYDCYLTGRIIQSAGFSSSPELRRSRSELMQLQRTWRGQQCESLQAFLRKKHSDPTIEVDPNWPTLK